jgi:aminocarboxymuconate-semialdehyde decarboxylase
MLFQCDTSSDKTGVPTTAHARKPRSDGYAMRVDIHCHALCAAAAKLAGPPTPPEKEPMSYFTSDESKVVNKAHGAAVGPKLTNVTQRLADMDAMGIDIQVVSPSPAQYFYWAEAGQGRDLSRMVNDYIAETVSADPARLLGLGTLPMQDTELALAELTRCVEQLGMRGIELCTNVNGEELSAPRFHAIYRRAQELGLVIFLHPMGFTEGRRFSNHYFNNVIGNPLDTTLALSHLIFDGVLDTYPDLKICVAHGGGFLPSYSARMDHAWCTRSDCHLHAKKKPSEYLKKMFFDTVVFDPDQLEYLVRKFGHDNILLGTDYPFDMGEVDPVGLVERLEKQYPELGAAGRDAILGGNAMKLLNLIAVPRA